MAADNEICDVLRAMEMLESRVRCTTHAEISFLVPMSGTGLENALARAVVGGWVTQQIIRSGEERAGVRTGTVVYRLTDMSFHRPLAA